MSDRKRKNTSNHGENQKKKKQLATNVRVSHIAGPDTVKPIIASSPGTQFPNVKFRCYARTHTHGRSSLLLHSSEHPTINHVARQDDSSVENHFKHFVAVFDPETGRLKVTEARRLTVRSAIRVGDPTPQNEGEQATVATTNYVSRAALTMAFGTKKSKTAARSIEENRLLAQGTDEQNERLADAMFSDVADGEESPKPNSIADSLFNKPLPPADLQTNDVNQAYSLDTLVLPSPASVTLSAMPTQPWTKNVYTKQEIHSRYRFVAHRVGFLASKVNEGLGENDGVNMRRLQVLRYIELLLDLHAFLTRLAKRKSIPPTDKWPELTMSEHTPMALLRPIMKHFFPERIAKDQAVTLLRTTILALTLHIPPPREEIGGNILVTEPTDISMDMAVEINEIRKLYRELGCKVAPAKEGELTKWGLEKLIKGKKDRSGNALPKPVFVKLELPLQFPKLSKGQSTKRR